MAGMLIRTGLWLVLALLAQEAEAAAYVSRATGNWGSSSTWSVLTTMNGTITTSSASATITGSGSSFSGQLSNGTKLYTASGALIGTVQSIANNTSLSLTGNAASSNSGISYATATNAGNTPGSSSSDIVEIAAGNTVTLDNNYTIATLTIESTAILTDSSGKKLTASGNITNNGSFTSSSSGLIASTGNSAVITGSGSFANTAKLYTSGTAPSIAVAASLSFTGSAQLQAGVNASGTKVSGSVLTINGTLNGSGQTGGTSTPWIYLSASSTIVASSGALTATGTATLQYAATGTLSNNGTVSIPTVRVNSGTGTWTNGANASLTATSSFAPSVLNASASGNTMTFTSPAHPVTPSSNTYYNLAGTGVTCPVSYAILGTSPCSSTLFVWGSPSSCVSSTGVGSVAWSNPGNAISSNSSYATAGLGKSASSNYLKCTGFNLNVPAGAIISGITVTVLRMTNGGTLKDAYVYLVKGGVISSTYNGATSTTYPTTSTLEAHGSQTNLWGTSWAVADLNATNFGVAFSAQNTSSSSSTTRTTSVDQIMVRVDYTALGLDHIRIEHPSTGSTCAASPITLKACANAACTSYYTSGDVTGINLSPTSGSTWSPSSSATITAASGGINSAISLARSSAGIATLGLTGTTVPATSAYECYNTTTRVSGDCSLNFSSSSFTFQVPDHTAGTRQTITLSSCASNFAGNTRNVSFWSTYSDPASGTLTGKVVAGSGNADCSTGYANLGTSSGSPTTLSLSFGAGATPQANFSLCYPDVGNLLLNMQYNGSSATGDAGVTITGSDGFIAKPDHFAVTGIKRNSDNFANPAASDATGSAFIAAGNSTIAATQFTATVTAKNALGATTPNFGMESTPEGIMLSPVLVAPSGGDIGLLTCKASTSACVVPGGAANFSAGATTVTDLAWNEAGVLQILPTISDGNYFTTGDVTTPTASGNIGRFYPHHFIAIPDPLAPIENRADWCLGGLLVADDVTPCSSPVFSYMNEKFNVAFTLTAQEASGATTTSNYISSATPAQNFAKLNLASSSALHLAAVDDPQGTPTYLTTRLDTTANPTGSFLVGSADIDLQVALKRNTTPDGPYANLNIGIAPLDSDGVAIGSFDLDSDATAGNDHALIGSTAAYFGRIVLANAFGSEKAALQIPLTAQYWSGSSWVQNSDDSSTTLPASSVALSNTVDSKGTSAAWTTSASAPGTLVAGLGNILLAAPSPAGSTGSVGVALNLGATTSDNSCLGSHPATIGATFSYLRGADCTTTRAYGNDPSATASFGIYTPESRKSVHFRELY